MAKWQNGWNWLSKPNPRVSETPRALGWYRRLIKYYNQNTNNLLLTHRVKKWVLVIIFLRMPTLTITFCMWRNFIVWPGARCIMFSGCPPVRPKPGILSICTWVCWFIRPNGIALRHVRPPVRPSVRPSVRRERFPSISRRTHGENEILQADLPWRPSELIKLWSLSVICSPFSAILT